MAGLDFSTRAVTASQALDFSHRAAPASADFTAGRDIAKSNIWGAGAGLGATIAEAIPGVDEVSAGLDAAGRIIGGAKPSDAWKGARDKQQGLMTGFREDHPNISNLATGAGYAAQAVPALMTGGATAAPQIEAAAGRSLGQRAGQVAAGTAKNATMGAAYAAGNAMTGRGSVEDRISGADAAIPMGAAVGVIAPAVAEGAGALVRAGAKTVSSLARTGVRAANAMASKGPGGAFLNPEDQVVQRLTEALQKDRLSPAQITSALDEWQRVGGASPAFIDIVAKDGGGQNTLSLVRGAAMSGTGRNEASKYGAKVAADLQDVATDRTRALTADTRTIPGINADVEGRIAANSQAPDVAAGSGGAQVHQALNGRYDQGKSAVDAAYDAVRSSDAVITAPTITQLPDRIRSSLADQMITPEVMGSLNPGTRAILGELDQLSGRAGRAEAAASPSPAASLESGIPTGGSGQHPTLQIGQIERVRKAINSRLSTAQGEDQVALQVAKREFDGWLNDALDKGDIQGDPAAIGLLKTARDLHAQQRTTFGGEDLLQTLTERDRHGSGRANVVAPEDASNAIMGRTGLISRQDLTRDLGRMRATLGENSPEWRALQQEWQGRILGRDAGRETFGDAAAKFSAESPQLANLVFAPSDLAAIGQSRKAIGEAVADRTALNVGRSVLATPSDEYAPSMTALNGRRPLAQVGAARELAGMIERPTEGATGVLNRIGSSTRATKNLSMTYGDKPAADYQASIRNAVDQVNNARFINPNTGAQTAGRLADETLVESIPTSKAGLVRAILDKFKAGATLTDEERGVLVKLATGKAQDIAPKVMARIQAPAPSMTRSVPVSPVLAVPMTQDRKW